LHPANPRAQLARKTAAPDFILIHSFIP
jgi:hypothetical protein